MNWAAAIAALGFLIVVHEAGHLVVARWCGMRVERFSIGFGPGILKHKAKSGTIYQLAPIPFGGFVEIRGMNIAEEVDPDDVHAYPNRPAWQRFLTIFAGPATNYLSAMVLAFALFTCHGVTGTTWHVGQIKEGYDAQGKLQPGDRILAVNDTPMYSPGARQLSDAVNNAVNKNRGEPVTLKLRRADKEIEVSIQPRLYKDDKGKEVLVDGKPQYLLGVIQEIDIHQVGVLEAGWYALKYPVEETKAIAGHLYDIITGAAKADPGGPVRIVAEFEKAFDYGWIYGLKMLMVLSVYIGLFNLFPLPALDGGRLVFLTYELVTRRRANPKIEAMVHMGGIMVLGVVMILVTLNDCNVF